MAASLVCLLLACLISGGSCALLKIPLPEATMGSPLQDACSDYSIVNKSTLSFPEGFNDLPKPWYEDYSTVGRSATVTKSVDKLLELPVPGLEGVTIGEVLGVFRTSGNCLSFMHYNTVLDQFLGRAPRNVDITLSCSSDVILSVCQKHWGTASCHQAGSVTVIGDDEKATTKDVALSNWRGVFFVQTTSLLEYSATTLGYDVNINSTNAVIDIMGFGVRDVCDRLIRISCTKILWYEWVAPIKLFRSWNLRAMGFSYADMNTQLFLMRSGKGAIQGDGNGFQSFYCTEALWGEFDTSTHTCTLQDCSRAKEAAQRYEAVFKEDLGDFWNTTAAGIIGAIKWNCTPQI